ncbi:hypothetical protein DL771_007448 [Monosporascus sp. 5C6A]|nr:hypothetical protein DL771_007448 [Monosporascus sp. 5C6A]
MPQTPTYSHNAAVTAITSFYEMVMRAHSEKAGELRYPPPGGWPQITQEPFAALGKTDTVIELMRHIPYIQATRWGGEVHIMNQTVAVNYIDDSYCQDMARRSQEMRDAGKEREGGENPIGPDVLCLADRGEECEYGYDILIDTKNGVVVLEREYYQIPDYCYRGAIAFDDEDEYIKANPEPWRDNPPFPIEVFFEMCKRQFRVMNWIPLLEPNGRGRVYELPTDHAPGGPGDRGHALRMQIFRESGWPGSDGEGRGWDRDTAERKTIAAHEEGLIH